MFDAGKGFFHFVFANRDDDFYTSSYIKMNFESYLRYKLIKENYRYICFLGREQYKMGKEYRLDLMGGIGTEILDQVVVEPVKKNKGLFDFFKKDQKPERSSNIREIESDSGFKIEHIETDFQTLQGYFGKILEVMSQKKGVAIVIPIDIFTECTETAEYVRTLINLQSNSGYNIIVLTSSVKALENDLYFKNPNLEYHTQKSQSDRTSIFFTPKLFPEIDRTFNSRMMDSVPKLIFTYDRLTEAYGERMIVWNSLPYEPVLRAVKYTFMHSPSLIFMKAPEQYAAIIWAWYANEDFREKHRELNLPRNEFRRTREITDVLQQKGYGHIIEKVIEEENCVNIKVFCERWACEDKPVYIVYDTKGRLENIESAIVQHLIRFKKTVKGHEADLGDDVAKNVSMMIKQFSKPSYQSSNNKSELPHEKFKDDEARKLLNSLYSSLEEKEEWNSWDDGSMYLLYTLFRLCYQEALNTCDSDLFNLLGEARFNKCMESLRYCMKNSVQIPFDTEKACSFANTTAGKLEHADQRELKKYIILMGD